MQKESQAFLNAKTATKTLARSLKIGDIIECFYADAEQGRMELVVEGTESSKAGGVFDIRAIPLEHFGQRDAARTMNTDKYRKVGSLKVMDPLLITFAASN